MLNRDAVTRNDSGSTAAGIYQKVQKTADLKIFGNQKKPDASSRSSETGRYNFVSF